MQELANEEVRSKMTSSRCDTAAVLMHSLQLWLSVQDLHKPRPVSHFMMNRGGPMRSLPSLRNH